MRADVKVGSPDPMLPPFRPLSNSLDLQSAFAQLSKRRASSDGLDATLRQLTAATGRMLGIERVSLWGLTGERTRLECIDLYELSRNRHSSGVSLEAARCPEYFRALERGEPIVADDAMTHPTTRSLTEDYLLMNGISAVINSPIHVNGELQGALCVEQVGPHSAWTSVQRLFTHSVASLVSLALLQHQLQLIEQELRDVQSLRQALFAGAPDAILISDARTGHILDANPQAERLFGRQRPQLLGVVQSDLQPAGAGLDIRELLTLITTAGSAAVHSAVVKLDGTVIPVEIVGQEVRLEKGKNVVQGVFRPLPASPTKS